MISHLHNISLETFIPKKSSKLTLTNTINFEKKKILSFEKIQNSKLIGQNHAIKIIADTIKRAQIGLASEKKPQGSFIFCGPTGVGKTEMAKCLSTTILDDISDMVRFDMSEFMESHSISKLLGTSPGYVGYNSASSFSLIKNNKRKIILFDEIEKAHPKIMDIFLQILDEGFVRDGKGKIIYFTNSIIIFTSNIGSKIIFNFCKNKKFISDKEFKNLSKMIKEKLMSKLRPEFINRFDDVVVFKPLNEDDIRIILQNILEEKKKLILNKLNLIVFFDNSVYDFLMQKGFSLVFGARQIKRVIQQYFDNFFASFIYTHENLSKIIFVQVDYNNDKLYFINLNS